MRHNSENEFLISKYIDCGLFHGRGCEDKIHVGGRQSPFLSKKRNDKI
jgi:hypothetical protein